MLYCSILDNETNRKYKKVDKKKKSPPNGIHILLCGGKVKICSTDNISSKEKLVKEISKNNSNTIVSKQ